MWVLFPFLRWQRLWHHRWLLLPLLTCLPLGHKSLQVIKVVHKSPSMRLWGFWCNHRLIGSRIPTFGSTNLLWWSFSWKRLFQSKIILSTHYLEYFLNFVELTSCVDAMLQILANARWSRGTDSSGNSGAAGLLSRRGRPTLCNDLLAPLGGGGRWPEGRFCN